MILKIRLDRPLQVKIMIFHEKQVYGSIHSEGVEFFYKKQVYGSIHQAYGSIHTEEVLKIKVLPSMCQYIGVCGSIHNTNESNHPCLESTPTESFGKPMGRT